MSRIYMNWLQGNFKKLYSNKNNFQSRLLCLLIIAYNTHNVIVGLKKLC